MPSRTRPHDIYVRVGATLAALRRAAGMTQEALAAHIGVEPSYVARIEAGTRRATLDKLALAADALGLPVAALFSDGDASAQDAPPAIVAALRGLSEREIALVARVAMVVRDSGEDGGYAARKRGHRKP